MRIGRIACVLFLLAVEIGSAHAEVLTYDIAGTYQGGNIAGSISIDVGAGKVLSGELVDTVAGATPAAFDASSASSFSLFTIGIDGGPQLITGIYFGLSAQVTGVDRIDDYSLYLGLPYLTNVSAVEPFSGFLTDFITPLSILGGQPSQTYGVSGTATLVADVPEPATWALLLLGLVGAAARSGLGWKPRGPALSGRA